jgi:hypothetical protein
MTPYPIKKQHRDIEYIHPKQILRGKRAASEQAAGAAAMAKQRRARSLGGRRVSFAPDDELETMHLFVVRACVCCIEYSADLLSCFVGCVHCDEADTK